MAAPTLTAYANASDLQLYYDWREIGEVVSDSAEIISANDQTDPTNVYGATIVRCLNRAAGEIEAAVMVSGMYTIAQLQGLTGNSLEKLKGANCDLAIVYLYKRKFMYNSDRLAAYKKETDELIEKLRNGTNVFNIPVNINAGTPEVTGLSTVEEANSGLIAYDPTMHYFPVPRSIFGNG